MSSALAQFGDPAFAEAFGEHRAATVKRVEELIATLAQISPGARVLDLCCGPGLLASALAERVGRSGAVIGVDSSPAMISLCERSVDAANVRFLQGDAYSLGSLLGQRVDHVVATSAWQNFLLDKERLAEQLLITLALGGRFSFDVRLKDRDSPGDCTSLQETARGLLARLARERWQIDIEAGMKRRRRGWGRHYDAEQLDVDLSPLKRQGFAIVANATLEESFTLEDWRQRLGWRLPFWLEKAAPEVEPAERDQLLRELDSELEKVAGQVERQRRTSYLVLERR